MSDLRIDNVVTSGLFKLDGGEWEVDNNVWIVGDDREVIVFDPAHSPEAVVEAVAGATLDVEGNPTHPAVANTLAAAATATRARGSLRRGLIVGPRRRRRRPHRR